MKDFKFVKDADRMRLLRPKIGHAHSLIDVEKPGVSQMLCVGANDCPICSMFKRKKSFKVRLTIFIKDIIEAFKRF